MKRRLTLPTSSAARKLIPLWSGFFKYFPAAIMGAAFHSKKGNDQHNPGEELHHAREKSTDHGDCILRHLMDASDMIAAAERGEEFSPRALLDEVDALMWRAAALSQGVHEKFGGAPMAPAARCPSVPLRSREEVHAYLMALNSNWSK